MSYYLLGCIEKRLWCYPTKLLSGIKHLGQLGVSIIIFPDRSMWKNIYSMKTNNVIIEVPLPHLPCYETNNLLQNPSSIKVRCLWNKPSSSSAPPLDCFYSMLFLWTYCGKYYIHVNSHSICSFGTGLFMVAGSPCVRQSPSRSIAVLLSADGIWGDVAFIGCDQCFL